MTRNHKVMYPFFIHSQDENNVNNSSIIIWAWQEML